MERLVYAVLLLPGLLGVVTYLTWFERKFAAIMQNRVGPYEIGRPHGWLQPIADVIKLLTKADVSHNRTEKLWFSLLPFAIPATTLFSLAFLPGSRSLYIVDSSYGVVLFLALSGLTAAFTYLAAWASNNKWASLSALRLAAQFAGFEIPFFASILTVGVLAGTLQLSQINILQAEGWMILHPLGLISFFWFFPSALAEANRVPFDIAEAESELVAAFTTEYSGIRFAMFYLAEYIHLVTTGWVAAVVFFGGSHLGPWEGLWVTALKIAVWIVAVTFLRWSAARLRIDQMLRLNWYWLVPGSIMTLIAALVMRGLQ